VVGLFQFIQETIETELTSEFDFLVCYDRAKHGIQDVVDMPDRDIDLFIRLCVPNQGRLAKAKRQRFFGKLTDPEVQALEECVQEAFGKG
jgi:hypothetical protein